MDFNFTEDQIMVRDLARGILEKEITPSRLREVERGGEWFDRALWSTFAEAGLLGLVVPADLGGMGFGFAEVCVLLQEIGRAVAPIPVLPTLVLAASAIAEFGTDAQKEEWLVSLVAGETILTGALVDLGSSDPSKPAASARREGGGWALEGEKRLVPAAGIARRVLVPAATGDGVGIFLLDPRAGKVTLIRQETSTGEPLFTLRLAGVRVEDHDLLGGDARLGAEKARWMYERAVVATCAMQIGVSERALELTSSYVAQREQFGVPIGTFQAVQHRSADCYIDLEAMRWVTWRAVGKLSRGLPATREAMVAKFWAADGGSRIASAAQHLHGGIGADVDYHIHRYFLWSKSLELSLGAAMPQLALLGRDLAQTGPQEMT
jgi:alkylation response protein AidB-like acyl-CoA dehydrogenase